MMAQVPRSKKRPFDEEWQYRLSLAAKVLGDIQEHWVRSSQPFPTEQATAVLVPILAANPLRVYPMVDDWGRSVEAWFAGVTTAAAECARLFPKHDEHECEALARRVSELVQRSAASWERVSLAEPSCEAVAEAMLDELVAARFVVVQYG